MKNILLTNLLLFGIMTGMEVKAQISWDFKSKKINDTTYEVHIIAEIAEGWTTYSQTTPNGGPAATKITFDKNPVLSFVGSVKEVGEMHKKHDDAFDVDVHYYMNKIDFVQIVKLKKLIKTTVSGKVFFMVCNAHQCMPPTEVPFKIELK